MSPTRNEFSAAANGVLVLSLLFAPETAGLAATFSGWEHQQKPTVPSAGVIRIALPAETLDAALSNLADLRVVDPAGNEAPYLLNQPVATPETFIAPKKFKSSLNAQTTVLSIETGVSLPLAEVLLATPEASFIKPVRIEGSNDGNRWQTLADDRPIFRQPNGANQLRLALTPANWAYLRINIDDGRSRAIPFTGATLRVQGEPAPTESVPVQIRERADVPGQTRLTLDFGAAHLFLTNVRLETPDTLFARRVTLVTQEMEDNVIIERPLGRGTIFRVEIEGQPPVAQLDFPINVISPGRELLLLIQNDDNPPLAITGIRAERRPVFLIFRATQAGDYSVLCGNKKVIAPRYDLGALGGNLKNVSISPLRLSGIVANPTYQPGETLPGIAMGGAALDVSDWRFRKAITVSRGGVQRLELDLEILSRAQPNFADLRLMREGKQVPIILERTTLTHSIPFKVGFADDPKSPTLSRWSLKMSQSNLPITRITCRAKATRSHERRMLGMAMDGIPRRRHQFFFDHGLRGGDAQWV